MARSPNSESDAKAAADPQSAFRQAIVDLDRRLKRGESFSGHERNCVFWNAGGGRWATASRVAGFDFDDDARAVALTDWDRDGDVDVWVTNRTAPLVRFLRNDAPRAGDRVAFDLQGTNSNRDAIGARVEVTLANDRRPIVRELRAGEGYLSQSSKRLTIGLGPAAEISAVTVSWPAGARERFGALGKNRAWRLVEGAGKAVALDAAPVVLPAAPEVFRKPAEEWPAEVFFAQSLPAPRLAWTGFAGTGGVVNRRGAAGEGETLAVLWSSGCAACAREFAVLASAREKFAAAGVRVLGLADGDTAENRAAAAKSGLEHGVLTKDAAERVTRLVATAFDIDLPLGAPSALVFDRQGSLAGVVRGAVDIDRLLAGIEAIRRPRMERYAKVLPFAGRWLREPPVFSAPLELVSGLAGQGAFDDALEFLRTYRTECRKAGGYASLCRRLGDAFTNVPRSAEAAELYREALVGGDQDPLTKNNLADALLAQPPVTKETAAEAVALATAAAEGTGRKIPGVLETFARAQLAAGRPQEALATAREALSGAKAAGDAALVAQIEKFMTCLPVR